MNGDEIIAVVAIPCAASFGIAVVIAGLKARQRAAMARLDLLREALRHPTLDEATRSELLRALVQDHDRPPFWLRAELWRRLWFGSGWLLLLICGGMWLLGLMGLARGTDDESIAASALLGLAMLSLPLGLRELARRDRELAKDG